MPSNRLKKESSPYLLQHAENPVDWYPYGQEAFDKAQKENKLLIISIGYSTCHWCHVMEHESFEDLHVAELMNNHFVSVKVDREERPDVDNYYMDSVSLMTGRGGWPLNIIALPDGRPVYGGTYFPKDNWVDILNRITETYKKNPDTFLEYATKLERGIKVLDVIEPSSGDLKSSNGIAGTIEKLSASFDKVHGGWERAPKFPMPPVLNLLLDVYCYTGNREVLDHLTFTLKKMYRGGIFDHLAGGFARYSTDAEWKIPHFEKMLYDNAQLLSVYSRAYRVTKDEELKEVIDKTAGFILREFKAPDGGYYSAFDADSEGEEGTFYIWKEDHFDSILKDDSPVAKDYFGIGGAGYWEKGNNVLLKGDPGSTAKKFGLTGTEAITLIENAVKKLLKERNKRPRPSLDTKKILSWNALTGIGLLDAYLATGNKTYLREAESLMDYLLNAGTGDNFFRIINKNGPSIPAFLDDLAILIRFLINHYQITFKEQSYKKALDLTLSLEKDFKDTSGPFYYLNRKDHYGMGKNSLPRKKEISDNVIPSSNGVLAGNLLSLASLGSDNKFYSQVEKMLLSIEKLSKDQPYFYGEWLSQKIRVIKGIREVAITGEQSEAYATALQKMYNPFLVFAASKEATDTPPVLKERYVKGKTLIYVCEKGACQLPVESPEKGVLLLG